MVTQTNSTSKDMPKNSSHAFMANLIYGITAFIAMLSVFLCGVAIYQLCAHFKQNKRVVIGGKEYYARPPSIVGSETTRELFSAARPSGTSEFTNNRQSSAVGKFRTPTITPTVVDEELDKPYSARLKPKPGALRTINQIDMHTLSKYESGNDNDQNKVLEEKSPRGHKETERGSAHNGLFINTINQKRDSFPPYDAMGSEKSSARLNMEKGKNTVETMDLAKSEVGFSPTPPANMLDDSQGGDDEGQILNADDLASRRGFITQPDTPNRQRIVVPSNEFREAMPEKKQFTSRQRNEHIDKSPSSMKSGDQTKLVESPNNLKIQNPKH